MRPILLPIMILLCCASVAVAQGGGNTPKVTSPDGTNDFTPNDQPYGYKSTRGGFWVKMPSGCGVVHKAFNEIPEDADPRTTVDIAHMYCNQNDAKVSGCAVSAIFNQRNAEGGPPGPAEVAARVDAQLASFGGRVVHQNQLQRELPDGRVLEGIDVYVQREVDMGEIWVRGLMEGGDIYVLVAWDHAGGLFADPEYQEFFNSFILIDE